MNYLQTFGPKVGPCNICGEHSRLTADHVPPKGVNRFPRMRLYKLVDVMGVPDVEKKGGRDFQQGVKFRTLCSRCNGRLLGRLYDPELIRLSNNVSRYLFSVVDRPHATQFETNPGLVARAVLGHILALGVKRAPEGPMAEEAAKLVLDPDRQFPERLKVYYWPYPFWDQVKIRGFGLIVKWGAPQLVASVLKYMPLAFLVSHDVDPRLTVPHLCLNEHMVGSGNHRADIPLRFSDIPPHRYPEAPGDDGAVLHGADSYLSERRS